jgi:peptidoglycan/LPS O-acetylase OafA/YrhL
MATSTTPATVSAVAAGAPLHFEPHIQGLRAIAVLFVVGYHFWPERLSGGYIGVDIFFVISGFLITGQIAREIRRSGTISLPRFWAKRARRLLPAATLVLAVSTLLTFAFLPLSGLVASLREILASVFYVENWVLAANSVDYLAVGDDPSLVQHYWSLAVEEQFYVLWPLLFLGVAWLAARTLARRPDTRWARSPLPITVAVVTVLSFAACVAYTASHPAEAYFVTFTRMWEFGVGGLLALLPALRPRGRRWTNLVGYAGLAVVLGCGYFYTPDTPFPGYTALLPVLGTAAVLVSAERGRRLDIGSVLSGRPQRFLGDVSYSFYLWHWPLLIIAPSIPGVGFGPLQRLALFLGCIVLGWLTKRVVEDPVRGWRFLTTRRPRTTYLWVLGAMALSCTLVATTFAVQFPKYEAAAAELTAIADSPPDCFGAAVLTGCENPALEGTIIPSAGFAGADQPGHVECFVQLNAAEVAPCTFGSTDTDAPRVALIGDSHAYQYIEVMIDMAEDNGWRLTTYLKGACPWTTAEIGEPGSPFAASCTAFHDDLAARLADQEPFDAIFTAARFRTQIVAEDPLATATDGYLEAWRTQAQGAPIVTIVDNPNPPGDPNKCLRNGSAETCAVDRAGALPETDPLALAAASQPDVTLLDFTDLFCDETRCPVVIGGADVYRDWEHLTVTFARTMRPFLEKSLLTALGR